VRSIPNTEWSGHLIYKSRLEGDTTKFDPIDIILMDIGSTANTAFDYRKVNDSSLSDYIFSHPDPSSILIGWIHSHHNMTTFFSDEDEKDLNNNRTACDGYLSVIVNNNLEIVAKYAQKVQYVFRGGVSDTDYINREVAVKYENHYKNRISELNKRNAAAAPVAKYPTQNGVGKQMTFADNWWHNDKVSLWDNENKSAISDSQVKHLLHGFLGIDTEEDIVKATEKRRFTPKYLLPEMIKYFSSRLKTPIYPNEITDAVTDYLDKLEYTNQFLLDFYDNLFTYDDGYDDRPI